MRSRHPGRNLSQLGITGTGYGGPAAWGAPYFTVQGYSPFGDNYLATPMQAWDTVVEGRDALSWQIGRHSTKFGAAYQRFNWPMWGFFQNRGFYQFTNGFTTKNALNDGSAGSALASFMLGLPAARQGQSGVPRMNLRQWYANCYARLARLDGVPDSERLSVYDLGVWRHRQRRNRRRREPDSRKSHQRCGVLQPLQPHQPGNAQPVRKHREFWQHH